VDFEVGIKLFHEKCEPDLILDLLTQLQGLSRVDLTSLRDDLGDETPPGHETIRSVIKSSSRNTASSTSNRSSLSMG
jgi:hypothetical protein